jgi:hypothetical protein
LLGVAGWVEAELGLALALAEAEAEAEEEAAVGVPTALVTALVMRDAS